MGTGSFPRVKYGRGVLLTTHPLPVLWSCKSIAISLLTLWAITGPVTETLYLYGREEKFMHGFGEVETPREGPSFRWIIVN
jgi:hypothetical protein